MIRSIRFCVRVLDVSSGLSAILIRSLRLQAKRHTTSQNRSYSDHRVESGTKTISDLGSSTGKGHRATTRSEEPSYSDFKEPKPKVEEEFRAPLRSSRVPSSKLGRLFHYGGLAAGIGWGTASEAIRRTASPSDTNGGVDGSMFLNETNVKRLVDKLTRMRGAALKLGQFMSIQDAKILPPQIEEIFLKVQTTADSMPFSQTESVLKKELGNDWRGRFQSFSQVPFAAASIGQVHRATIEKHSEQIELAIKVQFPGIFESITSDLSYLSLIANSTRLLPSGLFLSKTLEVLGSELKDECDYLREARCMRRMGEFLKDDDRFEVPSVFEDLTTGLVLSAQFMHGKSLSAAPKWSQSLRNKIGHNILELSLREIFEFRLMQTDPNWSNFLWNEKTQKIELIDFGATREYSREFVDKYFDLLKAGIEEDKEACIEQSKRIGYFTGDESDEMIESQFKTLRALGTPFRKSTPQPFDFKEQNITDLVRAEIPHMVRLRLTSPPEESYSLNRKLSGIFLLCSRLGSRIDCLELIEKVYEIHKNSIR
ncbi:ABC1 family-domain-containing protein [Phakopsora pachyrhizi]|uniref:ABC1 family-domain-containing protein n=1 Tax=Phakopsora pachyrhizi TaxID=170000 RepID=A0AAV0AN75_PHAPC|nr:ABC1 family-domain-containing protein [Phakopsora pachyrhizi]CAH7669575.1 ABC1 family-domain-containing protein [Phakopsora pachyrhizi]